LIYFIKDTYKLFIMHLEFILMIKKKQVLIIFVPFFFGIEKKCFILQYSMENKLVLLIIFFKLVL
jgi:hypothetical protein